MFTNKLRAFGPGGPVPVKYAKKVYAGRTACIEIYPVRVLVLVGLTLGFGFELGLGLGLDLL